MNRSEFDNFATEYHRTLAGCIRVSGETPEFFHRYKVAYVKQLCSEIGLAVHKILDFGSGVGNSVPFFLEAFPNCELTCADVSAKSLEISAARHSDLVQHLEITEESLQLDHQFDLIFSACVFHHIPSSEHVHWLGQLRQALCPGGLLAIFEHNPWNPLTRKVVRECPFDVNAELIAAPDFGRRLLTAGWPDFKVHYTVFFPNLLAPLRRLDRYLGAVPVGAQYVISSQV